MPQLVLNRGTYYNRGFFASLSRSLAKIFDFGPYFLVFSLVLFVVLITVITLMFSTRQVTKGYVLSKLDAQNQELTKENEQKEMQISQVRSLNFIEKSSKVSRMVRPDQIVFVDGDSAIAKK